MFFSLPALRASGQEDAFGLQEVHQCHQGQADQAVGVASLEVLKKTDAKAFSLEAAGAAIGLLGPQIALYGLVAQGAKADGIGLYPQLAVSTAGVEQAEPGMKGDAAAGHFPELLGGMLMATGLAQYAAVQAQALVGADDEMVGVIGGQGPGFGLAESSRQCGHRFAGPGRLIDVRAFMAEGQAQLFQKQVSGRGGGGQQEWQAGRWHGRAPGSRGARVPEIQGLFF